MPLNSTLSQRIFGVISTLTREYGQEPQGFIPASIMDREIKKLIRIKNEVATLEKELADKAGVSEETVAVAVRLRHLGVVPGTAYSKGNNDDDPPPAAA